MGRCDDGSDESISSPALAQAAVLKVIGRMTAIAPVHIQVSLKDSGKPATFTFSRTWLVPRLVLQLSAGHMALLNVTFLVADDDTACKDLLVGLPVLRHLGIDVRCLRKIGARLMGRIVSASNLIPAIVLRAALGD